MNLKYRARKEQRKKNNRNWKVIWFKLRIASKSSPTLLNFFLTSWISIFLNNIHCKSLRNNVSYSCTENISSFISSHSKKLLNSRTGNIKPCKCRKKDECPLNGQCLAQDIVYKCIASTSMKPDKTYLGTAEEDFKKRYNNHVNSFRHKRTERK